MQRSGLRVHFEAVYCTALYYVSDRMALASIESISTSPGCTTLYGGNEDHLYRPYPPSSYPSCISSVKPSRAHPPSPPRRSKTHLTLQVPRRHVTTGSREPRNKLQSEVKISPDSRHSSKRKHKNLARPQSHGPIHGPRYDLKPPRPQETRSEVLVWTLAHRLRRLSFTHVQSRHFSRR